MPQPPIAFHVLHFPPGARFRALTHFVRLRSVLPAAPGARFAKVMGCGRGAVFSFRPDWSRYAFLADWETEEQARVFYQSEVWMAVEALSNLQHHLQLHPFHSKGHWDGQERFATQMPPPAADAMAVITRADLKPWKLRSFFAHARKATAALSGQPGLQYSLGMGEWPFVRQATFSVWESSEAMKGYAYKNAAHLQAMRGKNQQKWYGEELYARFAVVGQNRTGALALFER